LSESDSGIRTSLNLALRGPFPDWCMQEGRGLPGSRLALSLSYDVLLIGKPVRVQHPELLLACTIAT
jgi:hypothetical protein